MDTSLLVLPIFAVLILGVATQLQEIAQDSSDKAVAFSEDMNGAMDCATRGVPIAQCSPSLFSYDFTEEQEQFIDTLDELEELNNETLENYTSL